MSLHYLGFYRKYYVFLFSEVFSCAEVFKIGRCFSLILIIRCLIYKYIHETAHLQYM